MHNFNLTLIVLLVLIFSKAPAQKKIEVDVCIYGGTSAGVIAAYAVEVYGKKAILIEPGQHLGGMSSGGLGYTDIGNKYAITGLARHFYRRVGEHYNKFEQWIFEPHIAENIFKDYIARANVDVHFSTRIKSVRKTGNRITEVVFENSVKPDTSTDIIVSAKMFIDCGYEGDLMAKAGVSYTVGRESNSQYGETINGVQLMHGHQFPDGIDPYIVPGDSTSGLVWGVSEEPLQSNGTGDKRIQAYNFRICLTSDLNNFQPITRPDGYDSTRYELLLRLFDKHPHKRQLNDYFIWSRMPNKKTDINNRGGFSTDMIGMNYGYPDGTYDERKAIVRDHEIYTKGLLYFFGHDSRVPKELRDQMLMWGYPKDEYVDNFHWSPQLYVREARRMVGSYVMTQANCEGVKVVQDGVGLAAYTMDSHNCQRIVMAGMVKNEGNVEVGGFGPYPISYRSLVPEKSECSNLLVPVCLSATHIAYGSIRMEPVFMQLAQSSAAAAVNAINSNVNIQDIDVAKLQKQLKDDPLGDGSIFEIVVDNNDQKGVESAGIWNEERSGGYGPTYLSSGSESKSVKFTPNVTKKGRYTVYYYFPKLEGVAPVMKIYVNNGQQTKEVILRASDVHVEGQTSGEWVSLGEYDLYPGKTCYVEVSVTDAIGKVIADAVILVPVRK